MLNAYWPKREEIKSLIYDFIHGTRESTIFKGTVNRPCFLIYYSSFLISIQYSLIYKMGLMTDSKQINNF